MVMKTKSNAPIQLIRGAENAATWNVPELGSTNAPSFHQPVEEEETQLTEEEIQQNAEAELQTIRENAQAEGFEAGRQQGLEAAQKEITDRAVVLDSLISQLTEPVASCQEKTQQQLLELAFAIARQIVRRELQQDPTQLIAVIREALKLLPSGAQEIAISLNPEDASKVTNALSIDEQDQSSRWQIKSDPSIPHGSCQVDTKNSKIDASIDKQIAVLFSQLVGGQRTGESTTDTTDSDKTNMREPGDE